MYIYLYIYKGDIYIYIKLILLKVRATCFPGASAVKNLPANAGGSDSISGSERSPREGNDNLFQYSCLGNPVDRGAWRDKGDGVSQNG